MSFALDLDFEDLLFQPSSSSSRSSSRSSLSSSSTPVSVRRSNKESMFDSFEPSSYREPSRMGRQQTRTSSQPIPPPQAQVIQLSPAPCPNHVVCPGAAHRHESQEEASFFVDPHSGVGKCCNSDCTWGFINGEFIITDLKGFAYSSRGQPVTYLAGGMYKHIRLVPRRV